MKILLSLPLLFALFGTVSSECRGQGCHHGSLPGGFYPDPRSWKREATEGATTNEHVITKKCTYGNCKAESGHPGGKREATEGASANEHVITKKCTYGPNCNAESGTRKPGKRDDHVISKNCVNDHCIECVNGACRESRYKREASEDVTSSSSNCVSNNGHETCTVCNNGNCHTTTRGKREAVEEQVPVNSCYFKDGVKICGTKREASEEHEPVRGCVITNGQKTCTVCDTDGNCHTTTTREASEDQNTNNAESHNTINIGKREAYHEYNQTYTYNETLYDNCNRTGCIRCTGYGHGDGCRFVTHRNCTSTGCIHCKEDGTGCAFVYYYHKRDVTSDSTDCVSNNGREVCTVCHNGNCHTTTNGKREATEEDTTTSNCVTESGYRKCTVCRNGSCHTSSKRSTEEGNTSRSCSSSNGREVCTVCVDGSCHTTTNGKREASEGVNSSSSNCVSRNGQQTCTVCNNGNCHTTTNGKRETYPPNTNSATSVNNIQF